MYKALRAEFGRADWNSDSTVTFRDHLAGVDKQFWEFGNEVYNGEFEILFPDLTVVRLGTCDWIMTQIMIMHIQASQCEALQEDYKISLASANTLLSGNETIYRSNVSSLTSKMNAYELLVDQYTEESLYDIEEYYDLVE